MFLGNQSACLESANMIYGANYPTIARPARSASRPSWRPGCSSANKNSVPPT